MKKNAILYFAFIVAFAISTVVYSQQINRSPLVKDQNPETDSILKVAKNQIHLFIDNIPETNIGDYGFNNKEEFKKITFDNPVKIYTLIDSGIVFTATWRVPVVVENEYRALLTIIKENNEYKAVDYGARLLAKEFFQQKTDETIGLLRVYELKSDFIIEKTTNEQLKFIPIQNGKGKSYNLVDIINMVKNN